MKRKLPWGVSEWLHVFQGIMVALGALLLGMGQGSYVLPSLAAFAAVTSVVYTDFLGWFRLHRKLANVVAVLAVVYAVFEFVGGDREKQLLSVATLLVYLQIVLLYQQKSERVYLEVAMLSLLQVVVASALSLGMEFGLLLVAYMFSVLACMVFFGVHRERRHDRPRGAGQAATDETSPAADFSPAAAAQRPAVELLDRAVSAGGFPLAALLRQTVRLTIITLGTSVVLFFLLPRSGESVWRAPGESFARETGFNAEGVSLNEMARMRESDSPAFRAVFRLPETGEPQTIVGEPYFAGVVLTEYRRGRWHRPPLTWAARGQRFDPALPRPTSNAHLLLQEISLEPTNERTLFAVFPAFEVPETRNDVFYRESQQRLFCGEFAEGVLNERAPPHPYHYVLATSGFRNGMGRAIIPPTPLRATLDRVYDEVGRLLQLPAVDFEAGIDPLVQLRATAERIVREAGASQASTLRKAQALEAHFLNQGLYEYSLDPDPATRTAGLDPIEDFVANHRTGHCELFASALVLMCRSQGIPARLVVGYKGGEFNKVGQYYTVRQLHAHAWAEVLLKADEIPPGELLPHEVSPLGAFARFDPTPFSTQDEPLGFGATALATVGEFVDYLQTLWSNYVLGLNGERQRQAIYRPLREKLANLLRWIYQPQAWESFHQWLSAWLGMEGEAPATWFNWRAGLLAMLGAATTYLFCLALYQAAAVWRRMRARKIAGRHRSQVPFYAQWEEVLARHGLHRPPGQTPREFAAAVARHLAAQPQLQPLAALPARVAEAFYRVRFGAAPLDKAEAGELEQAVGSLAVALASPAGK